MTRKRRSALRIRIRSRRRVAVGALLVAVLAGATAVWSPTPHGGHPTSIASDPAAEAVQDAIAAKTAAAAAAPPPKRGAIRDTHTGAEIPEKYVVALTKTPQLRSRGVAVVARELAAAYHGKLDHVYDTVLGGFSVQMSESNALRLAVNPAVDHVSQAQVMHVADTQDNPDWGLDNVDQRALPVDGRYSYPTNGGGGDAGNGGQGVTAYVVDTGIRITHQEFGGRASYGIDETTGTPNADDCQGHGTHVAGLLGGSTFGVAKKVKLVAVRVFGCTGGGTEPQILAGINWVTEHAVRPAVANASLEFTCSSGGTTISCPPGTLDDVNQAITDSIASGVTWVVAAGNSNIDACGQPYAGVATAITVGAVNNADSKATYSNWGQCINIWAPGGDLVGGANVAGSAILSAGKNSDTDTRPDSGTSMATPLVTGTAALILARPGWSTKTPLDVLFELLGTATNVTVDPTPAHNSKPRLLYTGPPPATGGSISAARNSNGQLMLLGAKPDGTLYHREQVAANAPSSTGWTNWSDPAKTSGWYSSCAQADSKDRVAVFGLTNTTQQVWVRGQATPADWLNWRSFGGLLTSCGEAQGKDGRLQVFGGNRQGQVWHASQQVKGVDTWFPFDRLVFASPLRDVVAERNGNDLIEVFALTYDGRIMHTWQTSPIADTYNPWVQLDGPSASVVIDTLVAGRNNSGLLTLYAVDTTGKLYLRNQVLGTNAWLAWKTPIANEAAPPAKFTGKIGSLAAETNINGTIELFAVDNAGILWHTIQIHTDEDNYTPWESFAGPQIRP